MIDLNKLQYEIKAITERVKEQTLKSLRDKGPVYTIRYESSDGKLVESEILDICGVAFIRFRDKRCSLARQWKKLTGCYSMITPCCRQELSVHIECANAVCKYINEKYNTDCYVESMVD